MPFPRRKLTLFLFASLFLHLLLVFLLQPIPEEVKKKDWSDLQVEILNNKNDSYQIADIAPPTKEEKPDKAKFAGLYDSRVEEEQVAPSPEHPASKNSDSKTKETHRKDNKGKGGEKLAMRQPQEDEFPPGSLGEEGGSLPEDFYPDYKVGNHTYLNVLRFPKIGYFVRLKKIFKTTFNPVSAIRPYLFSNKISTGQVEVVLAVSVDHSGNLAELFVIHSSGLELYDQEAERTIRDSSPFAAPPAEVLNDGDHLRMVWTFTVYL